ncbi:MAG: class I SAM-dependent methyltransferase [Planctomycetota bacterium]|jgi:SAM-dependent methyltransferase
MKQLLDIVNRKLPPTPWEEGDCIPWSDPAFSERMLKEHLCQDYDAASRRTEKIDEQVAWIHGDLLGGQPTKVLDLTCGPGLYTSRLARLGHECVGIDYAPAAIPYAEDCARREGLACRYRLEDIRQAVVGEDFGLAMMINGQFNVFSRPDARAILAKAYAALASGGRLLLEPQTFAHVEAEGRQGAKWHSAEAELFSDRPHLWLQENFWHAEIQANTERYFIIDAATGEVTRHAQSNEAYTDEQFHEMLIEAGFENVRLLPSLTGVEDESQSWSLVVVGQKP